MASTLLRPDTAWSKLGMMSFSAASSRLPRLWPAREPSVNRYAMSWAISGSQLARDCRQLRISPGAAMPRSCRSMPVLPPSSATVTMAVMLRV